MQIHIATTIDDLSDVPELGEGKTWDHARKFLEQVGVNPFADHLRWLEDQGRPVACVQVFLHRYPIGRAAVGMCLPEYPFAPPERRGRGYFKAMMADLFAWMRSNGYPLAYDHGRKGIYTRRGYAPGFHHGLVLIRVSDALTVRAPAAAEPATEAEVDANEELFRRPFPLGRGLQCRDERWRPKPACTLVVRAEEGIVGFAVLSEVKKGRTWAALAPPADGEMLTLSDAWAAGLEEAASLLRTAADRAERAGYAWLRINGRRTDPLARIAVLAGGELRWCAAQERDHTADGEDVDAFYLADLPLAIQQLLPELQARWSAFDGPAPSTLGLRMEDEAVTLGLDAGLALRDGGDEAAPGVELPRTAMTQAILGYAAPTELVLIHPGCEIPLACRQVVDALFPAREPHLIHEGWAFAQPADFGLAP